MKKSAHEFLIYFMFLFILLLTALNINTIFKPKVKVLGIETQNDINEKFWTNFTSKYPDYIPGWIELEEMDKVKQIDPNYLLP